MKLKDAPDKIKPFLFHGLDLGYSKSPKGQAQGDCPFCGKEDHFYASKATGQWDCKSCGESGNIPTFLRRLCEVSQGETSEQDYQDLSQDRGIPVEYLRNWGLVKSIFTGLWLLPAVNRKGSVSNVYVYSQGALLSTPGCKHQLLGLDKVRQEHTTVWILEGVWDLMAWDWVLHSMKRRKTPKGWRLIRTSDPEASMASSHAVVAVPGASVWKSYWSSCLEGKEVCLCYDSDHPRTGPGGKVYRSGYDGMVRASLSLGSKAEEVRYLKWGKDGYDPNLPSGYDLRDLVREKGLPKALQFVLSHLERVEVSKVQEEPNRDNVATVEPLERLSFESLVEDYRRALHFTPNMEATLAIMLAVAISTTLQGDQLWLRVIGPPGSGKSTLAEAFSAARPFVFPTSVITGFHSGFTGGDRKRKDASLIPKMDGKTTVIKDGDTLLSAPNKDRILSELRDLYDGTSRANYRNKQSRDYSGLRTTFIVCATDEIRALNRTFLGERFLDCEILEDEDTSPYLQRATENAYSLLSSSNDSPEAYVYLKQATLGFLNHKKESLRNLTLPRFNPDREGRTLQTYARFLAWMRARVKRYRDDLEYRPRVELATRLVGQLTKLAICLAIVLDKPRVDRDVLHIIRKVTLDTATGFSLEVCRLLYPKSMAYSHGQIMSYLGLPKTTSWRILQDMEELRMVTRQTRPNNSGARGRDIHLFKLTKDLRTLCRRVLNA